MQKAKEVTVNTAAGAEECEEGEDGDACRAEAAAKQAAKKKKDASASSDQLQEEGGEGGEEQLEEEIVEVVPELTEEEKEAQRIEAENAAIEENFEAYANLDAAEETKKL